MKTKSTSQSAFFNLRVLIGLFVFLAGAFLALLGFGTFSSVSGQTNENAFQQEPVGSQPERGVLTPVLGNYPDTSLLLSTNTTVTPDAAPTNTTSINVSTSTEFKGTLEGNPITGVVRVTDAHSSRDVHCDCKSLRQRRGKHDQDIYANRHDSGDVRPGKFRSGGKLRCW
jgi:hypothetical protein